MQARHMLCAWRSTAGQRTCAVQSAAQPGQGMRAVQRAARPGKHKQQTAVQVVGLWTGMRPAALYKVHGGKHAAMIIILSSTAHRLRAARAKCRTHLADGARGGPLALVRRGAVAAGGADGADVGAARGDCLGVEYQGRRTLGVGADRLAAPALVVGGRAAG